MPPMPIRLFMPAAVAGWSGSADARMPGTQPHPRVMRRPWNVTEAWAFVQAVLASPGLDILVPTEEHPRVAAQIIGEIPHLAGNLLHDAHTAILMREHGIRQICTRDADFHRFPFLEVIDPLQT
jgi:uncharacterized protein